ncbi:MAG: DUF2000 domain-containing protein [Deltaproteobacteria bacterium]|nr:DUF2000 domain-containing protein [Deltaproteobacteria bacterium]
MSEFQMRMVAVMNEKLEPGKALNALAHMCMGLGAAVGKDQNISKMPLVVLKANSNKIGKLREQALSQGISFTDFTDTMTVGSWSEQKERTLQTKSEALVYYGVMLIGDKDVVTELTRKFSLWK